MTDVLKIDGERLIALMDAALSADHARLRKLSAELVQLCLDQGDEATAKRIRGFLRRKGVSLQASGVQLPLPVDGGSRLPLLDEEAWPTTPVILNDKSGDIVRRFLEDIKNAELLNEKGLSSRLGLMLSGPPGTGKTLLAGHIAAQLGRPFLVARLDSLISSRLGETAKNIRQIFEFAPTRGGVLLLDELDAIAKLRDDRQELGELKRVVNTVIQGLDSLDDRAVVIAATNHPQLLDPAIWRRFPYRIEIGLPNVEARAALWLHFLYENSENKKDRAQLLGRISEGLSGAEIETIAMAARRLALLSSMDLPEDRVVFAITQSRPGAAELPQLDKLSSATRKDIVRKLAGIKGAFKTDIADLLGITRQMVHRYLQEDQND